MNEVTEKRPLERKLMMDDSEIKYFKYRNYKNVRSRKIKKLMKRDASQTKDHLKLKQSISKKMSSISFFTQNKDKRPNFRKTIRRKLSTMVVSMMKIF